MDYWQSCVLGLVQGATEFLPISSSAHLILIPWIARWPQQGLAYDVALHWGTLLALLIYFRSDWTRLLKTGLLKKSSPERGLLLSLFWGTVPGVVAGLFLEGWVEKYFRTPPWIACNLILFGILLGLADRMDRKKQGVESLNLRRSLILGTAQALAIFPGVSRSGITLTAGLLLGLRRFEATRFSFLLATPIILGAGVLQLKDLTLAQMGPSFWMGIFSAALSGLGFIHFMLRYVRTHDLGIFVFYRACLGLLILFLWNAQPTAHRENLLNIPRMASSSVVLSPLAVRLKRHVEMLSKEIG
ncbi:MAG: undecaprenyl-diphosphate phosphatase, partial [Elusimicrobia bacterium]|nr:undecaprenyl-diphosphate phosphatase [Elusimicrobiota bacterium]